MNVCIPVDEERGLDSPVCGHFGSAPFYLIVNADSGDCHAVPNLEPARIIDRNLLLAEIAIKSQRRNNPLGLS